MPEPFVEIHPDDARALGLNDFARVTTAHGDGIFKVALNEGQQRGSVFVPIHWNGETASAARVCELVAPHTDPFSGQPEAKATPASVAPVDSPIAALRSPARRSRRRRAPGGRGSRSMAASARCIASEEGPKLWREQRP